MLRYLKSSLGHGLFFPSTCDFQLSAYSDSNWASCPTTRSSTTGFFITLGTNPFSWQTKKQTLFRRGRILCYGHRYMWTCFAQDCYLISWYYISSASSFIMIIKLHSTLHAIQSSMSVQKSRDWLSLFMWKIPLRPSYADPYLHIAPDHWHLH